jgi:hypothetical protein
MDARPVAASRLDVGSVNAFLELHQLAAAIRESRTTVRPTVRGATRPRRETLPKWQTDRGHET